MTDIWNDDIASAYDQDSTDMYAPAVLDPAVEFLAGLAPGGHALEFAIGTGRVGLALRERGLSVAGIEYSASMADVLRAKPGGGAIDVTIGDMSSVRAPGDYDLVYVVYNAITCLMTQAEQVACFRNAARHLRPGGRFVIEVFVPDLRRLPPGAIAQPFGVSDTRVGLDTYDLVNQRLVSHHFWVEHGKGRVFHSPHRFVWPSELDLMGELAGLRLQGRWADWKRSEFTAESTSHVSVWQKPTG